MGCTSISVRGKIVTAEGVAVVGVECAFTNMCVLNAPGIPRHGDRTPPEIDGVQWKREKKSRADYELASDAVDVWSPRWRKAEVNYHGGFRLLM